MKIVIDLEYLTSSNDKATQKASFDVNELEYKINPDKEALRIAYEWFDRVRRDFPYDIKINSVKYNRDNDITEGLKNVLKREKRIATQEWKAPWE